MTTSSLSHYSDTITNFDLLSDLPPINTEISTFDNQTNAKFNALTSSNSPLVPIIYNNKISHYEINKKALSHNIQITRAKKIYRKLHLENMFCREEKATLIIINLCALMLIIMSNDSLLLLSIFNSEYMVNTASSLFYFMISMSIATYYLSACYIVLKSDVTSDVINGILLENKQPIGYKA
jgi:hypothetical protein